MPTERSSPFDQLNQLFFNESELDQLYNAFEFNESERKLVGLAKSIGHPQIVSSAKAISEVLLAKSIQGATERVIDSNEKLSHSNEKYSDRMVRLTRALVFVGAVQALVAVVQAIPLIVQAVPLIRAWL